MRSRRVGKGAFAPCPPSRPSKQWWARFRFAHPTASFDAAGSMQPEYTIDGAELRGLDQLGVRDANRIQRPLQLLLPELQEVLQRGKSREQIVILPDIALQQRGMIGHPIEYLRRRQ